MPVQQKIDSNSAGLFIAEETSPKVLPGTPVWYTMEPNSFPDFGGQLKTVVRKPINPARQNQKGTVTDMDASGGFQQDLTMDGLTRVFQGFMYADIREKKTTAPLNAVATQISSVTSGTKTYAAAAGLVGLLAGHLILVSNFGQTANNGVKTVASPSTASAIVVTEAVATEAAPPAAAKIEAVGFQFPSGDASMVLNGNLVRLQTTTTNLTTLGLIPGEWVFLGDDVVANDFPISTGAARCSVITANYIEFDKVSWAPTAESGAGKTIRMYFGSVIQTEPTAALVKRRTYQLQRQVGTDGDGVMSEYLTGACPNDLTFDIPTGGKITAEMTYVATDNEQRKGITGVKGGTYVPIVGGDAINTSSDFSRIKLSPVDPTTANPLPMFAFATDLKLTIKNTVTPAKAIGVLGAFDTSVGTFDLSGNITAYFSTMDAVIAVRNNADVTIDMFMAKKNKGFLIDIPLITLDDGRLKIEQDQSIKLPVGIMAAQGKFGTTMLLNFFPYLPTVAEA